MKLIHQHNVKTTFFVRYYGMWIEIPSEYQYGWMKTDSNGYVYVYKHNPWRYRGVDNKSAVVCTVDLEGEDPENTYQPIEMLNQSLHKGN